MFYNKTLGLYNILEGYQDDFGSWIEGSEQHIKDINVDLQPYSTELLLKSYGYNVEVTNRVFCNLDEDIKIGSTLKDDTHSYEIRKIIEWDDYMEVMIYGL